MSTKKEIEITGYAVKPISVNLHYYPVQTVPLQELQMYFT